MWINIQWNSRKCLTLFSHDSIANDLQRVCIRFAVRHSKLYDRSRNRKWHHSVMTALRTIWRKFSSVFHINIRFRFDEVKILKIVIQSRLYRELLVENFDQIRQFWHVIDVRFVNLNENNKHAWQSFKNLQLIEVFMTRQLMIIKSNIALEYWHSRFRMIENDLMTAI